MGKNWKGGKNQAAYKGGQHDFASCRGHGVIIGTSDAARERETSKELVNLLNQAIEEIYPDIENEKEDVDACNEEQDEAINQEEAPSSIENLLKAELNEVKQRKHTATQNAVSIKTDVKGITLIKLTRRRFCPIKLVNAIFERVKREKASCCRYVIRMIPLKHVFFPNEEELRATLKTVVAEGLSGMGITVLPVDADAEPAAKRARCETSEGEATATVEETTEDQVEIQHVVPQATTVANMKKFPYQVHFKARNHNVLTKDLTLSVANELLRPYGYGDVHNPQVSQGFCVQPFLFSM